MFTKLLRKADVPDTTPVEVRTWGKTEKFQSLNQGDIIKSTRAFGVEIECIPPTSTAKYIVANTMGEDLGTTDDGGGVEWQTPILKGKKGEDYIIKLCELMKEYKFSVAETCGLHIHLSGESDFIEGDSSIESSSKTVRLRNLLRFYLATEDVIQSFVPLSRRRKTWCRPIKDQFSYQAIEDTHTQFDIEKLWFYSTKRDAIERMKRDHHPGQRPGLNLSSLFHHNHIEIRYHSGTINARKILEWVNLHLAILDRLATGRVYVTRELYTLSSLEEKTEWFFNALALPSESVEYFMARQDLFRVKPSKPEYDKKKMLEIIKSDNEVLA